MIRVLIVEDDPMVAELNRRYVESVPGFQVIGTAGSPDTAFEIVHQQQPDLLLLDIYMPGTTGLDLLEKLRTAGFKTDAIVISAASDTNSIQKAIQFGAADYLMKPFQFERFQQALSSYAKRRHFFDYGREVKQSDIDSMLFQTEKAAPPAALPKGLTKETMRLVWSAVNEMSDLDFSAEDIAFASGVSRVSVRKYLSFLQEAGILDVDVSYGSIGRPQTRYRINLLKKDQANLYM